ncbi:MAG: glycosyltransferase [Alphaproteobacteria bacterium]|nr:glycosyltransferase [Alphaproteobacteria bacterium]
MSEVPTARTLLHVFPTFDVGGSQIRFAALANRLGRRYRHIIMALDSRHGAAGLLSSAVDFELRGFGLDKRRTLRNLLPIRRMIRESGAAELLTYNWGATEFALANLFCGLPHAHIEDGFGPEETRRQIKRRVLFRRLALSRAFALVLPSRTLERIAIDTWGFPRGQVIYVPNGVDCARFDTPPDKGLCHQIGIEDRPVVVGTVAALRAEKNIARLIRSYALTTGTAPSQLAIVGSGAEETSLRALARELGIADKVLFAGQISGVERILGRFDVYAISSDTEQMPISLIEAMAAGRPVASVDVGDIKIMLSEANRAFVTPVDDGSLADAISALLADPDLRRRIGAANAQKARREYDEDAMVAAYDELYAGRLPLTERPPPISR